jgi:hypothetical protein
MTPAQKNWIKTIHVAKRECGLDDEAYRLLLMSAAGVESARDIANWEQYKLVLNTFKTLGFRPHHGNKSALKEINAPQEQHERNPDFITARQEYYIRGLWDLASRKKDDASLRAMIKRIGGVDDIRFLLKANATKVILALREIAYSRGYDPDRKVVKCS